MVRGGSSSSKFLESGTRNFDPRGVVSVGFLERAVCPVRRTLRPSHAARTGLHRPVPNQRPTRSRIPNLDRLRQPTTPQRARPQDTQCPPQTRTCGSRVVCELECPWPGTGRFAPMPSPRWARRWFTDLGLASSTCCAGSSGSHNPGVSESRLCAPADWSVTAHGAGALHNRQSSSAMIPTPSPKKDVAS